MRLASGWLGILFEDHVKDLRLGSLVRRGARKSESQMAGIKSVDVSFSSSSS